jgi:type II secretory pathway component PulJ
VSLVELLVGVAVGLFVVLGAIAIYVGTSKGGREILLVNRLNQDVRSIMDIMVGDLRRTGYSAQGPATGLNVFTTSGGAATDIRVSGDADNRCILFAYDTTWRNAGGAVVSNPGAVDNGIDFGGFRLQNGVVQALRSTSTSTTDADCAQLGWEDLNDTRVIRVTGLDLELRGRCIAADPDAYVPTDPTTYDEWEATPVANLSMCDPLHPDRPPSVAAGLPSTEIRWVTIRLTGESTRDGLLHRQPLEETVVIRNHRLILP